ncbi:HoxN/HupN/NixA family nickel/cobalt transporter [Sporolactobacillus kofuensis]|uniref:Nickel/cobalt efflux system n=1 Tax=Sporolactobacillus kofuensis TaxID=269672 RepID=A0ABW1WEF8_9BACL|nr:HoxN/HupN/NixA family nickel/cobalt transporter [Sporolactobacillus kofuensis]MCO7175194.1 HoxN/HupN/NixA family nickel/cobalt transporter [Sporolactobacillus kofuensis]
MVKRLFLKHHWLPYSLGTLVLHVLGFSWLFLAAKSYPVILGIGLIAYTLGLRHAFDADHIAAIDNTVRKLTQQNKNASGVGFYFSLGHSTVVFLMAVILGLFVRWAQNHMPLFEHVGGIIGSLVSGSFLIIIAFFNLLILMDFQKFFIKLKHNEFDPQRLEELMLSRGLLSNFFKPLFKFINCSWQVYPLGFLFGLGFDTASEVALLALSADSAKTAIPFLGMLSLPLLFAAGMNIMDTTDSMMMSGAYKWAFDTPVRKIYYNMTITSISVVAALLIGSVELIQVVTSELAIKGAFWHWIQHINFNWLGYGLIIIFLGLWTTSYLIWKFFRIEERWNGAGI